MTRNDGAFRRMAITGILVSLGCFIHVPAAAVGPMQLNVNPTRASASLGSRQVSLTWTLVINADPIDGACTFGSSNNRFESPSGEFLGLAPLPVFQNPAELLSPDGRGPCIMGSAPQTRPELLVVPGSVIKTAIAKGYSSIVLKRKWTQFGICPSCVVPSPDVTIDISGGSNTSVGIGAEFSIARLDLRFEDNSRTRLIPSGSRLRAIAELNFGGAGLFTGIWEIAEPPSTQGTPLYRTLEMVTRNLAGVNRIFLTSPSLPSATVGLYLVRFRITSQGRDVPAIPVIQYYVGGGGPASPVVKPSTPLPVIAASGPATSAALTEKSSFSWAAAPGSRAYLLEVFEKPYPAPEDEPAGGVIVTGDMTATSIPLVTGVHFEPGRKYWWRVRAIGFNGDYIGESRLQQFVVPVK